MLPDLAALRRPSNPTREALQLRLDERKREPKSTLGSGPKVPAAIIAEVESAMVALTGKGNAELKAAVQSVLKGTEDGTVDPKALKETIAKVNRLTMTVPDGAAKKAAIQNLGKVDKFNSRDVQRAIGIAVPEYSAPIGEKWRREHVALIKSLGEVPKQRMVGLLREASQKQTRVETLKKQIENEFGVNQRRARLIARDQILTLNAKLRRDRHARAGITQYKWRVLDGSARSNHKHLDGKIFSYDDPPMGGGTGPDDRGNPGDGIGCRCQDIPIIPPAVKQEAAAEEQPSPKKPKKVKASAQATVSPVGQAKAKAAKPKAPPKDLEELAKAKALKKALLDVEKAAKQAAKKAEAAKAAELKKQLAKEAAAKAKEAKKLAAQEVAPIRAATVEEWVTGRSQEDRDAFSLWSQDGYEAMRDMQAGKIAITSKPEIAKALRAMEQAVAVAPKHQGRIYRGIAVNDADLAKYSKAGFTLKTEAFTSFSQETARAQMFAQQSASDERPHSVVFEFQAHHTRSADIATIVDPVFAEEREVLVAKGESLRVVGSRVDPRTGITHILMEESSR